MFSVEFYFPGNNVSGQNKREVDSHDPAMIIGIMPPYSHSFRFLDEKTLYWVGKEYSNEEFCKKYPQLKDEEDLAFSQRIVKARTGGFYPLHDTDVVVSI